MEGNGEGKKKVSENETNKKGNDRRNIDKYLPLPPKEAEREK